MSSGGEAAPKALLVRLRAILELLTLAEKDELIIELLAMLPTPRLFEIASAMQRHVEGRHGSFRPPPPD